METYGGGGNIAPPFLTSALDGGEWSASHPTRLPPGKKSPIASGYDDGRTPALVWTLWRRENLLPLPGTPTAVPVALRYTDYVTFMYITSIYLVTKIANM
jgi:hypothetical protein